MGSSPGRIIPTKCTGARVLARLEQQRSRRTCKSQSVVCDDTGEDSVVREVRIDLDGVETARDLGVRLVDGWCNKRRGNSGWCESIAIASNITIVCASLGTMTRFANCTPSNGTDQAPS